jgi:hypothetical protein
MPSLGVSAYAALKIQIRAKGASIDFFMITSPSTVAGRATKIAQQ